MTLGSNADSRTRGLIVSALTMARDLEVFRERGVVSSTVTLDDLACAQKVLAAVADALMTGDDDARRRLHRAAEELPAVAQPDEEDLAGGTHDTTGDDPHGTTGAGLYVASSDMPGGALTPPPPASAPPPAAPARVVTSAQPAVMCGTPASPWIGPVIHLPAPPVGASPRDLDATMPIEHEVPHECRDPLPFSGTSAPPSSLVEESGHDAIGETAIVSDPINFDVLPFGEDAVPSTVEVVLLSVQQYAALCAEREARPASFRDHCVQYHLMTDAQIAAVDEVWRRELMLDAALRDEFAHQFRRYCAWLEERTP